MFSGTREDGSQVTTMASSCAKKIATPKNPVALPKVPEDQMKNFNNFVEYLGLNDAIR